MAYGMPMSKDTSSTASKTQDLEVGPTVKPPSYFKAVIYCLLIAFSSVGFGYEVGTISGLANMPDLVQRFGVLRNGEYVLPETRTGLIVSAASLGCAFGGLVLPKVGDIWGRKAGTGFCMLVYCVGLIIQISATHSWLQFFFGRLISGFGIGCTNVLGPNFISEIAPRAIRGVMVSTFIVTSTFITFMSECIVYGCRHNYDDSRQWRVPVGICFAWVILTWSTLLILPESPRFLIMKGKFKEATDSLCNVNNTTEDDPIVQDELERITESVQGLEEGTWPQLLTAKPKMWYRTLVSTMVLCLQQLVGIDYFFFYGTTLFRSVGIDDSYLTSIIFGAVTFAGTASGAFMVDRFGRRWPLMVCGTIMAICLLIFSIMGTRYLYPREFGVDADIIVGRIMIAFSCIYMFCYGPTWGPIVYAIMSESFPISLKAKGSGVAMSGNWIFAFLIAYFTPSITSAIHFAFGYVFFGCTTYAVLFVVFFVPETKGMNLEDINHLYEEFTPGLAFRGKH